MDDIKHILLDKNFELPEEIDLLKSYIQSNFKIDSEIVYSNNSIILKIPSAAVASILRTRLDKIKKEIKTTKKIRIIIV